MVTSVGDVLEACLGGGGVDIESGAPSLAEGQRLVSVAGHVASSAKGTMERLKRLAGQSFEIRVEIATAPGCGIRTAKYEDIALTFARQCDLAADLPFEEGCSFKWDQV